MLDTAKVKPPPKIAEDFYRSKPWKILVRRIKAMRGHQCEDCKATHDDDGKPIRLIGDHVVERRDGGAELDPSNVRLLCWPCHNKKTAKARAKRFGSAARQR